MYRDNNSHKESKENSEEESKEKRECLSYKWTSILFLKWMQRFIIENRYIIHSFYSDDLGTAEAIVSSSGKEEVSSMALAMESGRVRSTFVIRF